MAQKKNGIGHKVARTIKAFSTATRINKADEPTLGRVAESPRGRKEVMAVASAVNNDLGEACNVMSRSSLKLGDALAVLNKDGLAERIFDPSSLASNHDNILDLAAFLCEPNALMNLARFQRIIACLTIPQMAKLLEPLAKGQVLVKRRDWIGGKVTAIYRADEMGIPIELQALGEVPAIQGLFAILTEFAQMYLQAAESLEKNKRALQEVVNMGNELSGSANEQLKIYLAQNVVKKESRGRLDVLLSEEEKLSREIDGMKPDSEGESEKVEALVKKIGEIAECSEKNSNAETETIAARAQILQAVAVQLEGEDIRRGFIEQIGMSSRICILLNKAITRTMNAMVRYLMGARLEVMEIQAIGIKMKTERVSRMYEMLRQQMAKELAEYEAKFGDVEDDGFQANHIVDAVAKPEPALVPAG